MTYKEIIDKDYLERLKALNLPTKKPNNEWTILHMCGDDKRASAKFNFQVYRNKRNRLTLVTNDLETLRGLLEGKERISEKGKRLILIDDSGWGFPIGGVLCGVYDSKTGKFYERKVEVKYFQEKKFANKLYLDKYKDRVLEIIDEINPIVEETVIKICTGYINIKAKKALRQRNFLVVEVDKIGEPLQTWLETQYRAYVRDLVGHDIYYDPKGLLKKAISRRFYKVVDFARAHNLTHLVKTGWKYFQEKNLS